MSDAALFPSTARFRDGLAALNGSARSERFALLLSRVIAALPAAGGAGYAFTAEEEASVCALLGLDAAACRLALETAAFIFERAAAAGARPPALLAALSSAGLDDALAAPFAAVWHADGPALLSRLRGAPLGAPAVLAAAGWRSALALGSSAATRGKGAEAVLSFDLDGGADGRQGPASSFSVQLSHAELLAFFDKLDRVQAQIDELSSA